MKNIFLYGILILCLACSEAWALDVAGVELPEITSLGEPGTELILNGAGVRRKFFVKIYVGALYLSERSHDIEKILTMPGPKRVTMNFLHSKVRAEKIVDGWNSGFSNNLKAAELNSFQERLTQFNALFPDAHKGDQIRLDYLPGQGTQVWMNQKKLGVIPGEDFCRALLLVWLGPVPADSTLKKALLGIAE